MAKAPKKSYGRLTWEPKPSKTYKAADPRAQLAELDGLRGVAILAVSLCHVAVLWAAMNTDTHLTIPLVRADLLDILEFGYLGVPLFFLLSGYLLTWTEEKRRQRGSYSVLNFAKRRALRILPIYYLAIVVVILSWPTILPEGLKENSVLSFSFGSAVVHSAFLQGFVPFYPTSLDPAWWSLTPEIVFYAILPLLVLKAQKLSQRVAILAALFFFSSATRVLQAYGAFNLLPMFSNSPLGPARMWYFPTTLLYLFLVGVVLRTIVEQHPEAFYIPSRRQLYLASTLSVGSIALLLALPCLGMNYLQVVGSPTGMIAETAVILAVVSFLLGSPILKPALKGRPIVLLGEISYSLFLLQFTVFFALDHYLPIDIRPTLSVWLPNQDALAGWIAFLIHLLIALAAAIAISYLSYRYIESPFLRRKPK